MRLLEGFVILEAIEELLDTGDFMSHGHCYLWNPALVSLSSDLAIGLSYVAISLTFGAFIIAQGRSAYWFSGAIKFITAVASVTTAVLLPPLVPKSQELVRGAELSADRKLGCRRPTESSSKKSSNAGAPGRRCESLPKSWRTA